MGGRSGKCSKTKYTYLRQRTRPCQKEVLLLDDTPSNEKSGEKQKFNIQKGKKRLMNIVVVRSHYADRIKDFPVGLSPYIPEDKIKESEKFLSKVGRTKILVSQARNNDVDFGEVLF